LLASGVEVDLGQCWQKLAPRFSEDGARCLENSSCAVLIYIGLDARIETATPSPLIDVERDARPLSNRADLHVSVVDVPTSCSW
jgi:hypothetical protein